jgi:hypothetical protein
MKKPASPKPKAAERAKPRPQGQSAAAVGKIHPVIIYPFRQPGDYSHLEELYGLVARLDGDVTRYARPITVIDRKTQLSMEGNHEFTAFRQDTVARHSDILDAWCVDTCQMWYSGLGMAFEKGGSDDVYWLIPGDFNYGSPVGKGVLGSLHDLPEIIAELGQDVCIGEIETDHNNSKQLIDTYGTFALLYTWFPNEAAEIRQYTERPRSEFFAVRHSFLREVLAHRWFAYEQTVVMLLLAAAGKRKISRFSVGQISDLESGRDSLASAIQQVERAERVLKTVWLERYQAESGWFARYAALEAQSDRVKRTALGILGNLLR